MKLLFMMGANKTCSCTWNNILNQHPQILLLPGLYASKDDGKHWHHYSEFLGSHPHVGKTTPMPTIYNKIYNKVHQAGYEYKYFGPKWAKLHRTKFTKSFMDELKSQKVIFTVRDLKTWLAHQAVINKFNLETSPGRISEVAKEYVEYYLRSFMIRDCYRAKLDDFILDYKGEIGNVGEWLKLDDFSTHCVGWWATGGHYNDPLKMAHVTGVVRKTTFSEPLVQDLNVEINNNEMWEHILPIFNKYYFGEPDLDDLDEDLRRVRGIRSTNLLLSDCYKKISRTNLNK